MESAVARRLEEAYGAPEAVRTYELSQSTARPQKGSEEPLGLRTMRASAYLSRMPGSVAGNGGHNALFAAARKMVRGFNLPGDVALKILREEFNPRCEPPWDERDLIRKVEQASVAAQQPFGYMLDKEEDVAPEVSREEVRGILDRTGVLDEIKDTLNRRIRLGFEAAPGPLGNLNLVLGGGCPAGAVTLLGAPPGQGKSSLALGWADYVAKKGRPAVYCSLEMGQLDLYSRLTTLYERLNWMQVRCGRHKDALLRTVERSLGIPLYIATRQTVTGGPVLRAMVDELVEGHGQAPFVVVDYLQLMVPVGREAERFELMGRISSEIRDIAQETGAPIMCITAVNRQSYNILDKDSHKPDMSLALQAAKLSGCLEYDAEAIMGLQLLDGTEDENDKLYGWVCVAKNRSGGGRSSVPVHYDGVSGNFFDCEEDDLTRAFAIAQNKDDTKSESRVVEDVSVRLRSGTVVTSQDGLCKLVGGNRNKVRRVIARLIDRGIVIRDSNGNYKLKGE